MASLQARPYALQRDEGQKLQSLGAPVLVKATSEHTSGAFNLNDHRDWAAIRAWAKALSAQLQHDEVLLPA